MSKRGERKQEFTTISGLPIERVYHSGEASAESPGEYPYTRGVQETMYRGRLWTMRQYAGFGTAKEANERYKYLLAQGTTGLSIAFDLPTQMGRDADHARSTGEVGKVGVCINSVDDMEVLLDEIPLEQVSISMTINATAPVLLAFLLVVAERRGTAWTELRGTIQNDILKEYIARGTYIYPPRPALRLITDIFAFCTENVPKWNTISISGYHIREAGSTAVQEIAFTLADAICYVEAAVAKGLDIDSFAPRIAFFFNCHNEFLEEIAKFRAARRLWATIMKERFGAKDEKSMMLRFHTQTAGSSLTAQQPLNNIVRTSVQAMAAVLGGTQSLHTNSYDEAIGLPTPESATIALRTQQVLAYESGVGDVVDPFGGSHLIESWTDRIELEVKGYLERIDTMGGMLDAIEAGFPQDEIERAAYSYQQDVESGERIVVGVNQFIDKDEREFSGQTANPTGEAEQCKRLCVLREGRDQKKLSACLSALKAAASASDENLMGYIVSTAREGGTLGEISDILREVYGEYARN